MYETHSTIWILEFRLYFSSHVISSRTRQLSLNLLRTALTNDLRFCLGTGDQIASKFYRYSSKKSQIAK